MIADAVRGKFAAAELNGAAFGDTSILQLAMHAEASVRLRNSLVNASVAGTLPFKTLGEYLAAGETAIPMMLQHVRSFGRKTALELDGMVRSALAGTLPIMIEQFQEFAVSSEELLAAVGPIDLEKAFAEETLSVRLANSLAASKLGSTMLSDFLSDETEFIVQFRRQPNVGRTTIAELRRLAARAAARRIKARGGSLIDVERLLGDRSPTAEDLQDAESGSDHACVANLVSWLLDQVPPRSAEIIRLRFGLGRKQLTLEEAGLVYGVTRERIRQLEAKAIRTFIPLANRCDLDRLLAAEWSMEWLLLTSDSGRLTDRNFDEALRRLTPELRLLLEVTGQDMRERLTALTARRDYGWIGPPLDLMRVDEAAMRLQDLRSDRLPRAIDAGSDYSMEEAAAAVESVLGLPTYRSYIVHRPVGSRSRRTVDLHSLLISMPNGTKIDDLVRSHFASEPSDPCSVRDALIVMQEAPHLFVEVADNHWCAIGSAAAARTPTDVASVALPAADPGEGTIGRALLEVLTSRGPQRLHTLYKEAADILPPGRSPNSIGPVLICRPDLFERALPGIYGIRGSLPNPERLDEEPPDYLLDEHQLRLFALARRSGEPMSCFPLWSPSSELALARWGRAGGRSDFYRSLLAVAKPEQWPVSATAAVSWRETIFNEGRFTLAAAAHEEDYELPEAERLLAAALLARSQGTLGWMGINRSCQRRIDVTLAVGLLALMVRAELLQAPGDGKDDWQRPHRPGPALHDAIALLSSELARTGHLDWRSGAANGILAAATSSRASAWTNSEAFASMVNTSLARTPRHESEMSPVLESLLAVEDDLISSDQEADWLEQRPARMTGERGQELMDWLLGA